MRGLRTRHKPESTEGLVAFRVPDRNAGCQYHSIHTQQPAILELAFLVTGYDSVVQLFFVRAYSGAPTGVTAFGLGYPDARGITPRIGAGHSPAIGSTFEVNLSRVPSGASAYLCIGTSNQSWQGTSLPLALPQLPGCALLVSGDALLPVTTQGIPSKGCASLPFALPNDPGLRGLSLFAQWIVLGGGPSGPSFTRALHITVQ